MGYLVHTVADAPEAIPIAFAIGCAMNAMKGTSLGKCCRELTGLFRRLRTLYGMSELTQLRARQIWDRFVTGRMLSRGEVNMLAMYDSLASLHVRAYLEGLNEQQRVVWEKYALPLLPAGFITKQGQRRAVEAATKRKRKEQSDVLVPLFPLLVEMAQLRKQAAERLAACRREQSSSPPNRSLRERVLHGTGRDDLLLFHRRQKKDGDGGRMTSW